jgi:hypothetical protein
MNAAQSSEMTQDGIKQQLSQSLNADSYSDYDKQPELIQLSSSVEMNNQGKVLNFQRFIQSPEDLDIQIQSSVRNLY